MNDRIRQFMNYKGLSSSELADSIGIQRSNLTHVLNGRNKPSFPFIAKLLEAYPEIDAKWLLLGQGNMLEQDQPSDLFTSASEQSAATSDSSVKDSAILKDKDPVVYEKAANAVSKNDKEVDRIVVFYTDQTFKSYTPSK